MATTLIDPEKLALGTCRTVEIALSNGGMVIVDERDVARVSAHTWHCDTSGYARARLKVDGRWKLVRMHRFLTAAPLGTEVDHADCNRLNNARANLRLCTRSENAHNIAKRGGTSSRYKGVSWHGAAQKWCAQIRLNGKRRYLGVFESESEAGAAYAAAARRANPAFARVS